MDSNSNSIQRSQFLSAGVRSKRDNFRWQLRRTELESRFNEKRVRLQDFESNLAQKEQELETDRIILEFNKAVQAIYESFLLFEYEDAISHAMHLYDILTSKNKSIKDLNIIQSKLVDENTFEELIKVLQTQKEEEDIYILILIEMIEDICDMTSDTNEREYNYEMHEKILVLFGQKQYNLEIATFYLRKYKEDSPAWLKAVMRQRFIKLDQEIFETVIQALPSDDAWLILQPLQNIPHNENLVQAIWKYRFTEKAMLILKKTLCHDVYLNKYLQFGLFSAFSQIWIQAENKPWATAQILDSVLQIACLKMDLFDKMITSGLAFVIAATKITDFSYEGYYNLYRICYWMKSHNSPLFQKNLKEENWFQNLMKLLVQQDINQQVQQSACDIIKQLLTSPYGESFRSVLKSEILPDNVSNQLNII